MYLSATRYVFTSKYTGTEEGRLLFKEVADKMGGTNFLMGEDCYQSTEMKLRSQFHMKLRIAYWRKANQIHKYFVDKCAGGKDECRPTYVEREDLEDLLNRCKTILEDHSKAEELLPTQSGFFFGSTEYDEWYFQDLEDTVPVLEKILKDAPKEWEFEYQAYW